jgi:phosphoribosylcarboxyaminoimidazole (NCAIR) mutase
MQVNGLTGAMLEQSLFGTTQLRSILEMHIVTGIPPITLSLGEAENASATNETFQAYSGGVIQSSINRFESNS